MRIKETHVKFIGCLFIIYFSSKVFENKKGGIKILVYGSVIDIDQMVGCNLFCGNVYQRLRAICVERFTFLRFSLRFVSKPHRGVFVWTPGPTRGIGSFSKTKWQMPGRDGHAWNWLSNNTSNKIFGKHIRHSFAIKWLPWKFHVLVVQNNGKNVQSCFFCQLARSNKSIKINIDISIKRVNPMRGISIVSINR